MRLDLQPPVRPAPERRKTSRFDMGWLVLAIILSFVGWGIMQGAHMMRNAELGFVRFEAAQKDLFIDAGLIDASRRVKARPALVKQLRRQTVMVISRMTEREAAVGTGVILRKDAFGVLIVTAKHVVHHAGPTYVEFYSAPRLRLSPYRITYSNAKDIAFLYLRAAPRETTVARIARRPLQSGQPFVVVGHPRSRTWFASPGIDEHHLHYDFLYCQTCDRGDSGAGVFNARGELEGIVVSKVFVDAPNWRSARRIHATAFFMLPITARTATGA